MTDVPKIIDFDPESITFDEAELIEEISGLSFGAITKQMESGDFTVKVMRGMVLVALRRDNPDYSADDVGGLSILEVGEGFEVSIPKDPETDGSG